MAAASFADWFQRVLGPGMLAGITLEDWFCLLRQNRFAIPPKYWPRAAAITAYSLLNTAVRWPEELILGRKWRQVAVKKPLFILGHLRSGTTHLHYLLDLDDRLTCPNFFQCSYPLSFLLGESWGAPLIDLLMPKRRVMDGMQLGARVAAEDELASCVGSLCTPYLGWAFPQNWSRYERHWTFQNAPAKEIQQWQSGVLELCQKLTWKSGQQLVLKSPPHTGRIRLLLELFPDAQFVHIYRNPFVVFQSTRHLWNSIHPYCSLQQPNLSEFDDRIIRYYKEMHEAFFDERNLIPEQNYHEIRFEELERSPLEQLQVLYEKFELPDFALAAPKFAEYLGRQRTYQKNQHRELEPALRERLKYEWRRVFEEWGYETDEDQPADVNPFNGQQISGTDNSDAGLNRARTTDPVANSDFAPSVEPAAQR